MLVPNRSTGKNELSLSSPAVIRFAADCEAHFAMWYTVSFGKNESGTGREKDMIALAISDDGLLWRRVVGPLTNDAVFTENRDQWWAFDTTHISVGSVLFTSPRHVRSDGGIYCLYYTGRGNDSLQSYEGHDAIDSLTRIGVAISKDGEHFTRVEGAAPSGAILDISASDADVFDNASVGSPCVLYDRNTKSFSMYYQGTTLSKRMFAVGRATSTDGFYFERDTENNSVVTCDLVPHGVTWAEKGVCRPSVVQFNVTTWGMFVEVIGADGKHRIALTKSVNGITWGSLSLVLDVGQRGQWDSGSISHPCAVLFDDGTVWLYYSGERESSDQEFVSGEASIGVARSDGLNWHSFTRL